MYNIKCISPIAIACEHLAIECLYADKHSVIGPMSYATSSGHFTKIHLLCNISPLEQRRSCCIVRGTRNSDHGFHIKNQFICY